MDSVRVEDGQPEVGTPFMQPVIRRAGISYAVYVDTGAMAAILGLLATKSGCEWSQKAFPDVEAIEVHIYPATLFLDGVARMRVGEVLKEVLESVPFSEPPDQGWVKMSLLKVKQLANPWREWISEAGGLTIRLYWS